MRKGQPTPGGFVVRARNRTLWISNPIATPAQPKNKIDRTRNFSLNQITRAAGKAVKTMVDMKIMGTVVRSPAMLALRSAIRSPGDARSRTTNTNAEKVTVTAPHPANQPPSTRRKLADRI
jgi:hypothetical protein